MYPATATATATATSLAADPAVLAADPAVLGHSPPPPAPELIEFIDFKWLMAAEGHRIDLGRLQSEIAYTRGCLALAAGSTSATLRQAAGRLARSLGLNATRLQAGP